MARKIAKRPRQTKAAASDGIQRSIFYILLFFIALQPLIFITAFNNFWDLSKSALLYFTATAIIGLFLYGMVRDGAVKWRRSPLDIPLLMFLVVATVLTFFSSDILRSVYGEYRRFEGLVSFYAYAVIFFAASNVIRSRDDIETVFKVWMIPIGLSSIYGILQHFGYDFFAFSSTSFEINRAFGTMGNPIKFATLLATAAPILAYLFIRARSQAISILALSILLMDVVALFFTFGRAGWISFVAAILTFLFLAPKTMLKEKLVPVIVMIVAVSGILLFVNSLKSPLEGYDLGSRLSSISDTGGGSNAARLNVWSSSIKMANDKPLTGFGIETFRMHFPRYRQETQIPIESGIIEYDRPHNDTLQMLTGFGFVGLAFYLFMILIPFMTGIRHLKQQDDEDQILFSAAFAGMVSYIISIQFSFTNVVLASQFLVLAAIAFFLVLKKPSQNHIIEMFVRPRGQSAAGAQAVVIIIVALLFIQFLRLPIADNYYKNGNSWQAGGQIDLAVANFKSASSIFPAETFYQNSLGTAYMSQFQVALQADASADQTTLQLAVKTFEDQITAHPWEKQAYISLEQLYVNAGDLEKTLTYGEMAVKLDPFAFDALVPLAYVYQQKGDNEKAIQLYERSLVTRPQVEGEIFVRKSLVGIYGMSGSRDKLIEQLKRITELDPTDKTASDDLKNLMGQS